MYLFPPTTELKGAMHGMIRYRADCIVPQVTWVFVSSTRVVKCVEGLTLTNIVMSIPETVLTAPLRGNER